MKSRPRKNRMSNNNKVYIKCEICGSTHINVLALSPKQTSCENSKVFDAEMGWLAICSNCNSQVIVTERWITPTKIVKDLSDLELSRNKDTDVFENGVQVVDVERVDKWCEIIRQKIVESEESKL